MLALGQPADSSESASAALSRLMEGNARFAASAQTHPRQQSETREKLAAGQTPVAIVVACSDSRVGPELIFDQGLGDLFVVRCAGNTVDKVALGSIEYAVEHLGVHLLMVVGHEQCGAVKAAIQGGHLPGSLPSVVAPIRPAVAYARKQEGDLVHNSVVTNALRVGHSLRRADSLIAKEIRSGQLKVVAANYDLKSGKVTLLE